MSWIRTYRLCLHGPGSPKGKTDPKKVSPESAVNRNAGTWGVWNRMAVRECSIK